MMLIHDGAFVMEDGKNSNTRATSSHCIIRWLARASPTTMASTSSSVEATAHQADTNFRVLSVQSHVVSGYVGNKSAVFPLQLHGIDVDIINTVHFSNHTGYKKGWEGERLTGEQLGKLVDGMERNDLLHQTHLLTGYIGSAASLRAIVSLHQRLKQRNPSLMFGRFSARGEAAGGARAHGFRVCVARVRVRDSVRPRYGR